MNFENVLLTFSKIISRPGQKFVTNKYSPQPTSHLRTQKMKIYMSFLERKCK